MACIPCMFSINKMARWKLPDLRKWTNNGETSIPDVAELDLSCDDLDEIPDSVFKLTSLKKLVLHNNNLQFIPEKLFGLTNLEVIDFTDNNLADVPDGIKNLTKLKFIYLNCNPIERVPKPLLEMEDVECHTYYHKPSTTTNNSMRYSGEEIQNIGRIARRGERINPSRPLFSPADIRRLTGGDVIYARDFQHMPRDTSAVHQFLPPISNMIFDSIFTQQNIATEIDDDNDPMPELVER